MRRKDELLANLNEHQLRAVTDSSKACLVNAHVGSGKTTVLISKVFYMHEHENIPFSDMAVLTFTNKAANEIKERALAWDPGVPDSEMRYFGNFHSVSLKLLKNDLPVENLGYAKDFTVIDAGEEVEMATRLMEAGKLSIKFDKKLRKRIDSAIQGKPLFGTMKRSDDIMTLIHLLQQERLAQNRMNFDDLILNATQLLKTSKHTPRFIVIDEFQDCNKAQLDFIRSLAGEETKIFAVGDPNQIIYTWRGSSPSIFEDFKHEFSACELSLPLNYRSSGTILEAARCFLNKDSMLNGIREQGSLISVKNHYDPFSEAHHICDAIAEFVPAKGDYKDIGIFYRVKNQSKLLENVLSTRGIPYDVSQSRDISDEPVLAWIIRLLKFSSNARDIDSALFALAHSEYGACLSKLEAKELIRGEGESCELYEKMLHFKEWCDESGSFSSLYDYFNLDYAINPTSTSFEEDKKILKKFFDNMGGYCESKGFGLLDGIKDFINSSAVYGMEFLAEGMDPSENSVKLMTLHTSKGLEFKSVFMIGNNDGLMPLRTKAPEGQDEERRLFFVGITRARDFLEVSFYTNPGNLHIESGPSRLVRMIPPRLCILEPEQENPVDLRVYRTELAKLSGGNSARSHALKKLRKVKHPKYGIGTLVLETEDDETVFFPGFGEIEFLKGFSELEDHVEETDFGLDEYMEDEDEEEERPAGRQVRHRKYGVGTIIREDEMEETVFFEGFGEIPFLKGLGDLEEVEDPGKPEKMAEDAAAPDSLALRRVRHRKYGVGIIIREDAAKEFVLFEEFGEISFLKGLGGLEDIADPEKPIDCLEYAAAEDPSSASEAQAPENPSARKVRHRKYGVGRVVSEDMAKETVVFEGFGEISFLKGLGGLEDLSAHESQKISNRSEAFGPCAEKASSNFNVLGKQPLSRAFDEPANNSHKARPSLPTAIPHLMPAKKTHAFKDPAYGSPGILPKIRPLPTPAKEAMQETSLDYFDISFDEPEEDSEFASREEPANDNGFIESKCAERKEPPSEAIQKSSGAKRVSGAKSGEYIYHSTPIPKREDLK
ncbi:MAG: ATP-dependent helicase [Clostridiales bacterium]|nr:ATP-dependent helicase [Clostridiales bacterium]